MSNASGACPEVAAPVAYTLASGATPSDEVPTQRDEPPQRAQQSMSKTEANRMHVSRNHYRTQMQKLALKFARKCPMDDIIFFARSSDDSGSIAHALFGPVMLSFEKKAELLAYITGLLKQGREEYGASLVDYVAGHAAGSLHTSARGPSSNPWPAFQKANYQRVYDEVKQRYAGQALPEGESVKTMTMQMLKSQWEEHKREAFADLD